MDCFILQMSNQRKVIDLQKVVREWADQRYDKMATRKMRRLKGKKCVAMNIDWSEVSFVDHTQWPRLAESLFDDEDDKPKGDANSNGPVNESKAVTIAADGQATKASILFQTKFTNNTEDNQEYTMRTEKTTRSSCTTTIENGYTRGVEMSVALKTPCEVFEANAGFHREISLTNSHGQTVEEEVNWGVESHINVKRGYVANAKLIIEEKKYDGTFTITSRISGMVHVSFTNSKDNNAMVYGTSDEIYAIVEEYLEMQRNLDNPLDSFVEVREPEVIVCTRGKCDFRFGVKQQVLVEQVPMSKDH